ncbi:hypothetical protein AA0X95_26495 [Bacillus sp. 1P10SD]
MAIMVYGEGGASTDLEKKTFPYFEKRTLTFPNLKQGLSYWNRPTGYPIK